VAVRDPGRPARGSRAHAGRLRHDIGQPAVLRAWPDRSKGVSPLSGLARPRRLKEWCRPPGAPLSRMRDRGRDLWSRRM
jgi:hypothetical protein